MCGWKDRGDTRPTFNSRKSLRCFLYSWPQAPLRWWKETVFVTHTWSIPLSLRCITFFLSYFFLSFFLNQMHHKLAEKRAVHGLSAARCPRRRPVCPFPWNDRNAHTHARWSVSGQGSVPVQECGDDKLWTCQEREPCCYSQTPKNTSFFHSLFSLPHICSLPILNWTKSLCLLLKRLHLLSFSCLSDAALGVIYLFRFFKHILFSLKIPWQRVRLPLSQELNLILDLKKVWISE